jgi:hypothetical protein
MRYLMVVLLLCWQGMVSGATRPERVQVMLSDISTVNADCLCGDISFYTGSSLDQSGVYTLDSKGGYGEYVLNVWEGNVPATAVRIADEPRIQLCPNFCYCWDDYITRGEQRYACSISTSAIIKIYEFSTGFWITIEGNDEHSVFFSASYESGTGFGYMSRYLLNEIPRDTNDCSPGATKNKWIAGKGGSVVIRELPDKDSDSYTNFKSAFQNWQIWQGCGENTLDLMTLKAFTDEWLCNY